MTSAVLYGTTSDNELRPVRVTDSGEFVTDGGGGGDWYENFYVGGTQGNQTISLLWDGTGQFAGSVIAGNAVNNTSTSPGCRLWPGGSIYAAQSGGTQPIFYGMLTDGELYTSRINGDGQAEFHGDVYGRKFIDSDGYDLGKIGQALSTIHDVIESVDDLNGLKNLFHLLLDNLKSDPTPLTSPTPPEPPA